VTNLQDLLSNPAALMAHVGSLTLRDQRPHEHPIFVEMAAAHPDKWNLIETLKATVDQGGTARQLCYFHLVPALAHLRTMSPSELCGLLAHFRANDTGYTWAVERPLTTLFGGTDIGRETLLLAISDEGVLSTEDIELLADILCRADPDIELEFFDSMPTDENELARAAVLRSSCTLLDLGAHAIAPERLEKLWQLTRRAIDSEHSAYLGWEMGCRLAQTDERAKGLITAAALLGPEKAQAAIFRWITVLPGDTWPNAYLKELVGLMLSSALKGSMESGRVDALMALLLNRSKARAAMLDLCDVIMDRLNSEGMKRQFSAVFATLTSDRALFPLVLTRYLLRSSTSVLPLRELIQHAFLEPPLFVPDPAQFRDATPEARLHAIHRLLAETVHGVALCQFIYRFGVEKDLQPWGSEVFKDVFINHIALEFPQTALEFLKERVQSLVPDSRVAGLIRQVLEPIQHWHTVLMSLPIPAELQPATEKVLAIQRHDAREQRRIQKEARAASVFASIATQLNVTQGRRVISRSAARAPTLIELKTFTHSLELPGSEISDPLAGLMRRLKYLETPK
jgi:hypothetical protein